MPTQWQVITISVSSLFTALLAEHADTMAGNYNIC